MIHDSFIIITKTIRWSYDVWVQNGVLGVATETMQMSRVLEAQCDSNFGDEASLFY